MPGQPHGGHCGPGTRDSRLGTRGLASGPGAVLNQSVAKAVSPEGITMVQRGGASFRDVTRFREVARFQAMAERIRAG